MFKRNLDIREAKKSIPVWVIAERLGVHENTFHNWMKKEMVSERKAEVMTAIEEIKQEVVERKKGLE